MKVIPKIGNILPMFLHAFSKEMKGPKIVITLQKVSSEISYCFYFCNRYSYM